MLDTLIALLSYVGNMILLGFFALMILFAFIVLLGYFIGLLISWGVIGGIIKIIILLALCFGIGVLVSASKL